MRRQHGGNLRFNGLCQELASSGAEYFGQRIGRHPWMVQRDNTIFRHGVSLLAWRPRGFVTPHDTPPPSLSPSPTLTLGHSSRRVWFGHCGSEANDAMIRAVPAATGRGRFVSFIGGMHGGFSGAMSVSGYDALMLNTASTARSGQIYVPYPDPYRPPFPGDAGLTFGMSSQRVV